jgi:predicted lipoprotein with Yx(FWY)xxD motif
MKRTYPAIAILAVITGVVVAGCGSSGSSSNTSASMAASKPATAETTGAAESSPTKVPVAARSAAASAAGTTISLGSAAGVGKVLVDSKGFTLYYFQKDRKGSGKSKCEGACAKAWPPLTTKGKPQAGNGVKSAMLGTIKRSDGTTQVTYAGWPLYTFIMDKKPGEDNGTDLKAFGASWYPLHSNGKKAGH